MRNPKANLLINIWAYEKDFIAQAAQDTGFNVFTTDALTRNGIVMRRDIISVWGDPDIDHTIFWDRFDELSAAEIKKII